MLRHRPCRRDIAARFAKRFGRGRIQGLRGVFAFGHNDNKGKYSYEYTAFRVDSYPSGSGVHSPVSVRFTDDILQDAKRRDFKCNAVYYDLSQEKLVDPLGGIVDIKNGILSTADAPDITLGQDGLRIMRMIRFVSTLGYGVEEQTLASAKKLAAGLNDISVERIREELDKILAGDNCRKALELLNEIGALKIHTSRIGGER